MTMPKAEMAFPREEFLRRLANVKTEMERRGAEVLVVSTAANINYLTGYTSKSGYVPQGLIVSLRDEEPTFFTRRQDAPAARHQMFFDNGRAHGYPENLIANPEKDGFDAIIDFLDDSGLSRAGLALEAGALPSRTVDKFKHRLPAADVIDFGNAIHWIRGIKSDLEIAVMREAGLITDAAMHCAAEVIRSGVREADAAAEIIATLIRGVNGVPGTEYTGGFFLCASPRTATPHIRWGQDSFRHGSQVNLELSGVRHGYVAPLMRTFTIGKPDERLRRLHEGQIAGLEAALAVIKPGATCAEVASAFNTTLNKHGFEKESRCGYAIGIDWTEPTASLHERDTTVLVPNMTFHMMLGNWISDDLGYVISESFRVTETGAETFSSVPREMLQLPA